ncbi:MAG: tRNA (adenosine(37)-N6)-threonylcarbamoyltransferase complex ATPase subunit type 1 TsaE [Flavobacteriaceae bacterium]|nr:tRNA (adenosine(37)-N6)-threonylcarbamoyltransferase complex ATPase subunit type 1 TsaE [Flavobacteriaceae bacterium]
MEITYSLHEIRRVAETLVSDIPCKIWALYGPMGAGKTTLIKTVMQVLGSSDSVQSPTFGLVNEYHQENGDLLAYHFDFYRIEDPDEVLDIGFEDYINRDCRLFMEWPAKIGPYLPEDRADIYIDVIDANTRRLTFQKEK